MDDFYKSVRFVNFLAVCMIKQAGFFAAEINFYHAC